MEIYGFSWLVKMLSSRNSRTFIMPTYSVSDKGYIDFSVSYDGHMKFQQHGRSFKISEWFDRMLRSIDTADGKLCYGIYGNIRREIGAKLAQEVVNQRVLLKPVDYIQPCVNPIRDTFYHLKIAYYSKQYNTKLTPKVQSTRILHKIMDMAKVLMWEIEQKELKRVLKISLEFTVDEEGRVMLSYWHDIHLLKSEICLKFSIESEHDIQLWKKQEYKPKSFFDRDPSMRSLRHLGAIKKKNEIFMKHGQLRNQKTYNNIPIDYKSCDASLDSLEDNDAKKNETTSYGSSPRKETNEEIFEIHDSKGVLESSAFPLPKAAVDWKWILRSGTRESRFAQESNVDVFNSNFKEMLFKSITKEQMDENYKDRLKAIPSLRDLKSSDETQRQRSSTVKMIEEAETKAVNQVMAYFRESTLNELHRVESEKIQNIFEVEQVANQKKSRMARATKLARVMLKSNLVPHVTEDEYDQSIHPSEQSSEISSVKLKSPKNIKATTTSAFNTPAQISMIAEGSAASSLMQTISSRGNVLSRKYGKTAMGSQRRGRHRITSSVTSLPQSPVRYEVYDPILPKTLSTRNMKIPRKRFMNKKN